MAQQTTETRWPRWSKWRLMPEVQVWEAVSLSLGIEPEQIKTDSHAWMGAKYPFCEGQEFNDRLDIIAANKCNRSYFPTPCMINLGAPHLSGVRLSEFAQFAIDVAQWGVPDELRTLVGSTEAPKVEPIMATVSERQVRADVINCETIIQRIAEINTGLDIDGFDGSAKESTDTLLVLREMELREAVSRAISQGALRPRRREGMPYPAHRSWKASPEPWDDLYFASEEFALFVRNEWALSLSDTPLAMTGLSTQVGNAPSHGTRMGNGRSDDLKPIIEQARSNAPRPNDTASVWSVLVGMANQPTPPHPLIGYVDGEGIKWRDGDNVKFLNKKSLGHRLRRASTR